MYKKTRKRGISRLGAITVLIALGGGSILFLKAMNQSNDWSVQRTQLPRATVERTDLSVIVRASGLTQSAQKTHIECQLERIRNESIEGDNLRTSGASTLTWLIPEGSEVRGGDVLATLDSSEYEEMVRQQTIAVEAARSAYETAKLDVQQAEIALKEYREGLRVQQYQLYKGQTSLAEFDLQRQRDSTDWANRMFMRGYVSLTALKSEGDLLTRAEIDLDRLTSAFRTYRQFTEVKMIQSLLTQVENCRTTLLYEQRRLEQFEELLAHYQQQVEACTVRSPHDGYVIYEMDNHEKIYLGMEVRRRMSLFYIPNLEQMEVHVMLNETVMRRVKPGMPCWVRVEALSDRAYTGKVISVANVVHRDRNSRIKDDVKNFVAKIRLDQAVGLMPEMTAEVEILTDEVRDTLVIPHEALTFEAGQEICYVVTPQGLMRQPVSTGIGNLFYLQVLEGLDEGVEVIRNPAQLALHELPVFDIPTEPSAVPDDPSSPGELQAEEAETISVRSAIQRSTRFAAE